MSKSQTLTKWQYIQVLHFTFLNEENSAETTKYFLIDLQSNQLVANVALAERWMSTIVNKLSTWTAVETINNCNGKKN